MVGVLGRLGRKVGVLGREVRVLGQEVESSGEYRSWQEVGREERKKKPSSRPAENFRRREKAYRPLVGSPVVVPDQLKA